MTCEIELLEQEAAENRADQPDRDIAENAAAAAEDRVRQPAPRSGRR